MSAATGKKKKSGGRKGETRCGACEGGWKGARGEKGEKEKKKGGKDIGRRSIPRASIQLRSCPVVSPWSTIYIYIFIRNLHDTPSTIVHSRASLVITTRRFSIHVVITTIMMIIISRSRNIARERNFSSPFLEFLGRSRTGEGRGECFSQI